MLAWPPGPCTCLPRHRGMMATRPVAMDAGARRVHLPLRLRSATGSPYETGSYGAIDARDAEAQVYARRRREQARRDTLRVVAIAVVAVVVLIVVLVVAGVLG